MKRYQPNPMVSTRYLLNFEKFTILSTGSRRVPTKEGIQSRVSYLVGNRFRKYKSKVSDLDPVPFFLEPDSRSSLLDLIS